jgi:hypothetical protein
LPAHNSGNDKGYHDLDGAPHYYFEPLHQHLLLRHQDFLIRLNSERAFITKPKAHDPEEVRFLFDHTGNEMQDVWRERLSQPDEADQKGDAPEKVNEWPIPNVFYHLY